MNYDAIKTQWAKDAQERSERIALQTMLALSGEEFGKQTLTEPKKKPHRHRWRYDMASAETECKLCGEAK